MYGNARIVSTQAGQAARRRNHARALNLSSSTVWHSPRTCSEIYLLLSIRWAILFWNKVLRGLSFASGVAETDFR